MYVFFNINVYLIKILNLIFKACLVVFKLNIIILSIKIIIETNCSNFQNLHIF